MVWDFGWGACGILVPQPGIEPTLPTLEGEVITIGPPGKSWYTSDQRQQIERDKTTNPPMDRNM